MIKDSTALLDTNILVYGENSSSPYHRKANGLLKKAWEDKVSTCIASQNLVEFFAIVTDSKRITTPLSPQEAWESLSEYINSTVIEKIYEQEATEKIFLKLVKQYKPKGQKIHDIRLVAVMLSNNITTIYTADNDFKKFKEIETINPFK